MKNKAFKIIFIVSFLPYAIVLLLGIIAAIVGVDFFGKFYGMEAFLFIVAMFFSAFGFLIPLFAVCLFYQICYLLRMKLKNLSMKKYVICCVIIGFIMISVFVFAMYGNKILYFFEVKTEENSAMKMAKNAEEKISYKGSETEREHKFDLPGYEGEYIFVDYDTDEIGLVTPGGIHNFRKFPLKETSKGSHEYMSIVDSYYVQAEIPLNAPGKKLVSFYDKEEGIRRTSAFLLIYEDGTVCFVDIKNEYGYSEFTGLECSEYFTGGDYQYKNHPGAVPK